MDRGKQEHIPCKTSSSEILKIMAVNYCGHQINRRLGLAAPAYHKKEGATQHPLACKFSLQYDGRPDEHFAVRIGMWNLGKLSGKGGEVCKEMRKRIIDVCCLQEV